MDQKVTGSGMETHVCDLSIWETQTERLQVRVQLEQDSVS